MKFPKQINAYCPACRSHQIHKVKVASKGRARTLAKGNRAHNRSLLGHGGKRAGEKTVKKQGHLEIQAASVFIQQNCWGLLAMQEFSARIMK